MIKDKIRFLREAKKLRHEDMAERLGMSRSAYSRLETGEVKLDVDRLQQIADVLDVPPEELLNDQPVVFNALNNSGGTNGCQHVEIHFPQEVVQQMLDRYDAQVQMLQELIARQEETTRSLLELLRERQTGSV